jgi:hypothetical protein
MLGKRVSLLALAVLALGAFAPPAQAAVRHIDGTVVSKSVDSHSFRIKTQNGNRVRIKVNANTRFERIAGFGALRSGLRVEVDAKSTAGGLVAIQVETQGGGGGDDDGGGDDHGGGGDDGPNHT